MIAPPGTQRPSSLSNRAPNCPRHPNTHPIRPGHHCQPSCGHNTTSQLPRTAGSPPSKNSLAHHRYPRGHGHPHVHPHRGQGATWCHMHMPNCLSNPLFCPPTPPSPLAGSQQALLGAWPHPARSWVLPLDNFFNNFDSSNGLLGPPRGPSLICTKGPTQ